ncbi:hypothetical protein vBVpaPMGD2_24 [Vibrio phage vB_VpaP_MGD2]|uniref:Uncharacterized protein n=1 Tax=Vibrio phage vB_VpaP_MGD2 TaxID=2565877 RepID=A0A6B7HXE1_9CAUD|nr:hypothetical protein vBVpaPMGD2_24 [Vibrio phage vB_VpaP_MGD2]
MPRDKQEVFDELYERIEDGLPVSVSLQEEAHNHGIRIGAVEKCVAASLDEEDDFDDE